MPYDTPPTKEVGDSLSAGEWNTYIRDNMAAMAPDIFTAKGDLFAASGANAGVVLPVSYNGYILAALSTEASGLVWASGPPQCRVSRSTAQSIPNDTATEISFDVEDADTHDFFPGSGTTITMPATALGAGLYMVSCYGYFTGHATSAKMRQAGAQIAGANFWNSAVQSVDATETHISFCQHFYTSGGTTIKMVVQQITGGSLNFNSARMAIARMR